jgi:TatD DNase family protein
MFIDTHCHIVMEYYDDMDDVIKRAINNNVKKIIVNGYDMKSNREILELVKKYDIVYGALGIQPEELDDYTFDNLNFIEEHINDDKIVAVGEIGLDYHYDTDRDKQKELFKKQLDIAYRYNKPVIIHSRDCIQETYNILKESKVSGVLHCYSGSLEMALEFNKIGFLIGIGGISTFKNAKNIIDVIKSVSLEYIILETDSPYLTPEPFRGKRNEPAYIPIIAKRVAEVKCLDIKEIEKTTTDNARRLFDI